VWLLKIEHANLLLFPIFQYGEVILLEISNGAVSVCSYHIHHHQTGNALEHRSGLINWRRLLFFGLGWNDSWDAVSGVWFDAAAS